MTSQPTVSSHTFLDCGDCGEIVTVNWKRLPDGKRVNPAFGGSRSLVRFDRQSPGGHVSVKRLETFGGVVSSTHGDFSSGMEKEERTRRRRWDSVH